MLSLREIGVKLKQVQKPSRGANPLQRVCRARKERSPDVFSNGS
jgi:hypothetical protein